MKRFLLLFFLPLGIAAQNLPDSSAAARMNVKKLVILRCDEGYPPDTADVFLFDKGWKNKQGKIFPPRSAFERPQSAKTNTPYYVNGNKQFDAAGRLIFCGFAGRQKNCFNDSLRNAYFYDEKGRLISTKFYSCEKGNRREFYFYDSLSRVCLWTCDPLPDVEMTREEYSYYPNGQLHLVNSWWTDEPLNPIRKSSDIFNMRLEYFYDENGLITEVKIDDPLSHLYTTPVWDDDGVFMRVGPSSTVYRYIYVY